MLIVEISDVRDRGRVVGKAVVTAPSALAALSLVADGDPVVDWTIPLPA